MKRPSSTDLMLELPEDGTTKQQSLFKAVRQAIICGRIAPEQRLPSTRDFAKAFGISRGTAVIVYDLLQSEGYLVSHPGAGTFAARALPDDSMYLCAGARGAFDDAGSSWFGPDSLSPFGQELHSVAQPMSMPPKPILTPSAPALDEFPVSLWARLCAHHSRLLKPEQMGFANPTGLPQLRAAIAEHLRLTRGIDCTAGQVFVLPSVRDALQLAMRIVAEPGSAVAVEESIDPAVHSVLRGAGLNPFTMSVDADGLRSDTCEAESPPRMAYVSPGLHISTGTVSTQQRRRALLDWAARRGTWIFESDVGTEFRFAGQPVPALFAMSPQGGVLHAGSFEQTLFPALHIAYLIVPSPVAEIFRQGQVLLCRPPTVVSQLVLCEFLEDGHYIRHLRRMTECYRERRNTLATELQACFASVAQIVEPPCGLNLLVDWSTQAFADAVTAVAHRQGLGLQILANPTSRFQAGSSALMGFGALPAPALITAVRLLLSAVASSSELLTAVRPLPSRIWDTSLAPARFTHYSPGARYHSSERT